MNRTFYVFFFFVIMNYIGTQGEASVVKAFKLRVVYTTDLSTAVVPMLFSFCVAL